MILVEATWEDQNGTENRSTHGACIRIRSRIPVGTRLSIHSHREQFSGVARHCRPDGKDFLVGILKDEVHRPILKKPPPVDVPKRETHQAKEPPGILARAQSRAEQRREPVPPGNAVRIETPIAERLMVPETRQPERPVPTEAVTPPTAKTAVPAQSRCNKVLRESQSGRNENL